MFFTCRLCLKQNSEEKLKNIFQCSVKYAEDSLVDILFWIFSIEIDVTDTFSKEICCDCVELIEYVLQVRSIFKKNQENLKNCNKANDGLKFQPLDDNGIEKICEQKSSPSYSTIPKNSPSKSRCNSKNIYGNCSPRVRVSLSTMEAMCPVNVHLVPFEKSQEYFQYRPLKNGSFKKRKYRHFNLDNTLLNDICSTLDDQKCTKIDTLKKDIGVSTEYSLISKASNTEQINLCTCDKKVAFPLQASPLGMPPLTIVGDMHKKADCLENDNFLDILSCTQNVRNTLSSSEVDEDYDWTTINFKKDASTNTENIASPSKNIGINATVHSVTTGTLTERFEQISKKDMVKVDIETLQDFCPKVVIEPLECILEEQNYKAVGKFRYIKRDGLESDSGDFEKESCKAKKNLKDSLKTEEAGVHQEQSKKQRFLDYYKNFSSFAVRELITGKKIRENESHATPVFKITTVCSVFVCDFCSKSFLAQQSLDLHCRRAHNKHINAKDTSEVIDLEGDKIKQPGNETNLQGNKRKRKRKLKSIVKNKPNNKSYKTKKYQHIAAKNIKTAEATSMKNSSDNTNLGYALTGLGKRGKQIPLKRKPKKRRKKNFESGDVVLVNKGKKTISYAWEQKSLGKYSAIPYCRKQFGDEKRPLLELGPCDIKLKKDLSLNDTIQKLANRLDESDKS